LRTFRTPNLNQHPYFDNSRIENIPLFLDLHLIPKAGQPSHLYILVGFYSPTTLSMFNAQWVPGALIAC
jgi:hypothetical protein